MPTYVYETVDTTEPERFEVRQHFSDPVLTAHPKTGAPVRRVISGGLATVLGGASAEGETGGHCGPSTCQCGKFS